MAHFKSLFLCTILSILQNSSASPLDATAASVVEVVPGPGLPSLKELGITSADLFRPDYLESRGLSIPKIPSTGGVTSNADVGNPRNPVEPKVAQYNPTCVYNSNVAGSRGNAIACRNYLITNGNNYCDVNNDYAVLCSAGDTEIVGWNYYNVSGGLLAYCSDVAVGAAWIVDNCSACDSDNCAIEGSHAAQNNDNYVVYIDHYQ